MWEFKSEIALLVALPMVLLASADSQQLSQNHTRKVGESCERDIQCVRHAFCRYQMTCLCDEFYAPSLDKATCHAHLTSRRAKKRSASGALCFDSDGCSSMANAECRQSVCTCKDNFMIDLNNSSNCIARPTRVGHFCQRSDECSDAMQMAHCIGDKCSCYTGYRFINETGTCVRIRGLYQPCKKDYECFLDDKRQRALVCRNGECACREEEPHCNKAGGLVYQPITVTIMAALAWKSIFQMLTRC